MHTNKTFTHGGFEAQQNGLEVKLFWNGILKDIIAYRNLEEVDELFARYHQIEVDHAARK